MAAKSDTTAPSDRKLYYLKFSFQFCWLVWKFWICLQCYIFDLLVTRNHAVKSLCVSLSSSCMCVCVCSYKVTFKAMGILKYNLFNLWFMFRGCEI